ncbi:MAG: hypothetical protein ACP5NI_04975, partial [Acetobacteraceae bacterium]
GIVYATSAGLYAYHAAVGYHASYNTYGKNKIDAFVSFITNHARRTGTFILGLYGFCPDSRPLDDANDELRHVAQGVGYSGVIQTSRWSTRTLGWGSTWVVVTREGKAISATIENFLSQEMREGDHGEQANADPADQKKAPNAGGLEELVMVPFYTANHPETRRAAPDWVPLAVPLAVPVKKKGFFKR